MAEIDKFVNVALPVPMRQSFSYLIPQDIDGKLLELGCRVLVPFGARKLVGIVIAKTNDTDFDASKTKALQQVLPPFPVYDQQLLNFLIQVSHYYHHPIGDVLSQALPVLLRQAKELKLEAPDYWQFNDELTFEHANEQLAKRSLKQKSLLSFINEHGLVSWVEMRMAGFSKAQLTALENKNLLVKTKLKQQAFNCQPKDINEQDKPRLTAEQSIAVSAINTQLDGFSCHLVDGITGSGKTEVYLQLIEQVLLKQQQVLVLVPEIGLTPQTLRRFERRFKVPVFLHHSGLNDSERLQTWQSSKDGTAAIIIGTRSAIFSPLLNPGLFIIDEEHDSSLKQQEGFRYHARDIAILRARSLNIPIVLGSATPSLESLHNAQSGKYHYHQLLNRAGTSSTAQIDLIDMAKQPVEFGLSGQLKLQIEQTLKRGEQVLIFLNRRGYAPAISCQECHWIGNCARCEKSYTIHQKQGLLICHHCTSQLRIPMQCPECGSVRLKGLGQGTEKLEQHLEELFPDYSTVRIDRDSTRKKGELAKLLEQVNDNEHQILVGTQMLAKGHHFPDVTLVAIVDVDGALFSFDFRAAEHMAQLLVQVSGRAGRASKPGKVLVQTNYPEHPLLQDLIHNGYSHFAQQALMEREQTLLPPFSYQALIRAEANFPSYPQKFLEQLTQTQFSNCLLAGPVPAAMEKKAGKYRFHLLIQSSDRKSLHQAVVKLLANISTNDLQNKVRWSVDIDPQDLNW